jgi:2-oxoglutarate/2-oxoacid ferredoxin oxidoreductase subunit beta
LCTNCSVKYNYEANDVKVSSYYSEVQPTWCSGCGDYAVWAAIKRAMVELNIASHEVLFCFDIGCNGNMSDKIKGYRIHSLHGRVLPLACGAKLANPNVKVIAFAGDGATYSEGINHFLNTIRSNIPITFFVHNNGNYGLTTGQASATTPQSAPRTASPYGPVADTLNPINLALSLNCPFVARGFSGDIRQLTEIFKEAIMFQEKGLAYVDILQACPTYNKETTHLWYQERVKDIKSIEGFNANNILQAQEISLDMQKQIATGILYKNDETVNYLKRLEQRIDCKKTLVQEVRKYDVSEYLQEFK